MNGIFKKKKKKEGEKCKTQFQLKHQIITFGNIYANELVIMYNSALSSVVSVLTGSKLLYQTKTNRGK